MIAMANYAIDPRLLRDMVPAATLLDEFEGRTYVSLIGFRFLRTRVRGFWIPFHDDFDEVNLRFYVKRTVGGEVRRGVAFIREIVPRYAIAKVAQLVYGEPYVSLPMRHRVAGPTSEGGRVRVEYGWRTRGQWNAIRMEAEGRPALAPPGSLQQFITEHYWGYSRQRD
ncbi:MAG: hypothetical protein JWP63_3274, partial [Candidatus Solibacter sp.]|nr:hypothetical protein [Candidatus Solibacter sp.]